MASQLLIPSLTAYDQPEAAEGALDPLGLYSISDALTVNKLCPGVRERQKHPGFLVPIAIGAMAAEEFTDQFSEKNAVSPIQVYEWYVVQSLVDTYRKQQSDRLNGLPGREKVSDAIDNHGCITPDNYLKTPSVFGFYGVYKRLARELGILHQDQTDEQCAALISAWEVDEKQHIGNIKTYSSIVRDAIAYGLKNEKTQPNWPHWKTFSLPINANKPGPEVSKLLWQLLCDEAEPLRAEYLEFMVSDGFAMFSDDVGERELHNTLIKQASSDLAALLNTIQHYETFSRLVTDAFNQMLYLGSHSEKPVSVKDISSLDRVAYAIKRLPEIQHALQDGLDAQGIASRLDVFMPLFATTNSPADWVESLISHHINNQQSKPPNGKMPFFDRLDSGSMITRPAYRIHNELVHNERYVHSYRSTSLCSFAKDLGMLN